MNVSEIVIYSILHRFAILTILDLDILIIGVSDYRQLHYFNQVPPIKIIRVRKIIIIAVWVREDALEHL